MFTVIVLSGVFLMLGWLHHYSSFEAIKIHCSQVFNSAQKAFLFWICVKSSTNSSYWLFFHMNYNSLCIVLKGDIQDIKWEVLSTSFCHYSSKLFWLPTHSWAFQPTSVVQGGGHGCYEQSFWWIPICIFFKFHFVFLNLCLFCWSFFMYNLFSTYIYTMEWWLKYGVSKP